MTDLLGYPLKRLQLRALREDDLDAFFEYRSDAEVAKLQGWEPMQKEEARHFLLKYESGLNLIPNEWSQIAIAKADSNKLVGDIGVHFSHDLSIAEFGITLTPSEQGKGYAVEAVRGLIDWLFSFPSVSKVLARTDVFNAPCNGALFRSGMILEDTVSAEYKGQSCLENLYVSYRLYAPLY